MLAAKATPLPEDVDIALTDEQRQGVIAALSEILADQHVLYQKLRNFHWNLIGPRFHSLHEFFEKQYRTMEAAIDQTAERIRMIGGVSPGAMAEFLKTATLKEERGHLIDGEQALKALIRDHELCIRSLRNHIKSVEGEFHDVGTTDFLTALLRQHEMDAWMLRSFLERPSGDSR